MNDGLLGIIFLGLALIFMLTVIVYKAGNRKK